MTSALKWSTAAGIGAVLTLMPGPATAGPGDVDKSGAAWWQWALSIPASVNPLLDTTGEQCLVGQHGDVWYLAALFFTGGAVTRNCEVPADTKFFVPVINSVNIDTPGICGQGASIPVKDLRAAAAPFIDAATNLSITVDNRDVKNLHRIKSGVFAVALPDDNLFNPFCGGPGTVPPGIYSPAIDDGYYAQINALSPGAHIVKIHAESGGFVLDVTYNLDVVATAKH